VTDARSSSHSQSLERGLAILSAFRSGTPVLGVSELSREVGLSRSTAHRYIATLATLGYLDQDPVSRKYRLGPRVLDLGFSAINSMDLREVAAPHLQALSDETGHTVNMAVLDGADIVYIERCRTSRQGQRDIDLNLHVGSRLPAYCTSMGKVLLAGLALDEQRAVLDRVDFDQRGPNTLTARKELLAELERVARAGLAVNNEELAYGLRSIAAPVASGSGEVVAAINLAVHRTMLSLDALVAHLGPPLKRTAAAISQRLGR
jgi:IclR family pca regulon transcriptional regulator